MLVSDKEVSKPFHSRLRSLRCFDELTKIPGTSFRKEKTTNQHRDLVGNWYLQLLLSRGEHIEWDITITKLQTPAACAEGGGYTASFGEQIGRLA